NPVTHHPVPGATVELLDSSNHSFSPKITAMTDASGYYSFDLGAHLLGPGTFFVSESLTGDSTSVGRIYTTINQRTPSGNDIRAVVQNLSAQSLSLTWTGDPYSVINTNCGLGSSESGIAGAFTVTVSGNQGNQGQIYTYCADLEDNITRPPSPTFSVNVAL